MLSKQEVFNTLLMQIKQYLDGYITKETYCDIAETYYSKTSSIIKNTQFDELFSKLIPYSCICYVEGRGLNKKNERKFRENMNNNYLSLKLLSEYQSDLYSWNKIYSDNDIQILMDEFAGFHDSCICSVCYASGAKVDKNKSMKGYNKDNTVLIKFDSQVVDESLQLKFTGVKNMNISAYYNNYFADIFDCYLAIKNKHIIWADGDTFDINNIKMDRILEKPYFTFVIASSLEWRFIEQINQNN